MYLFSSVQGLNYRQWMYQVLNLVLTMTSVMMVWMVLKVMTWCHSPLVVVISGSMEPTFHRGDLLFMTNFQDEPIVVGDVVGFTVERHDIPIVHRVVRLHQDVNGTVKFVTKGDNNDGTDEQGLYSCDQKWLTKKDVVGKVRGSIPSMGMFTLFVNDYPQLKYALLGMFGTHILMHRE